MVVDTATSHDVYSQYPAVRVPVKATSGSSASGRKLCGDCGEAPAVATGRCRRCYQWWRNHKPEERDRVQPQDRSKKRPTVVPRREEPDVESLTYAEWCASRGYNPRTKRYRSS